MNKSDIDWFPCLHLGHDKVNIIALQAANERATRTELRKKRMEETSASALRSTEIQTSVNEGTTTTSNSCISNSQEVQTDIVQYDDKKVQTKFVELCTKEQPTIDKIIIVCSALNNLCPSQGRRKRGGLSLPTFSLPFINYTINIPVTMIHLTMHVHFYNIKYMNPQSIILSMGGVAFLESIC